MPKAMVPREPLYSNLSFAIFASLVFFAVN